MFNTGKGGKNRRRGKNENENDKRELVFKEDGQEYAQVVKMLGNGRLEANCFDGTSRLCHIRGKLRKKASCCEANRGAWEVVSVNNLPYSGITYTFTKRPDVYQNTERNEIA